MVGLAEGPFAAGWEEDSAAWVALVRPGKAGAPCKLSQSEAGQIPLAYDPPPIHRKYRGIPMRRTGHLKSFKTI